MSRYYVRLMRPVFVRTVVEVSAESLEEAQEKAIELSEDALGTDWMQEESDAEIEIDAHPPVIERSMEAEDGDFDDLLFKRTHDYALLQADKETGEGALVSPSWLTRENALSFADFAQDWAHATEELYETGLESFHEWLRVKRSANNVIDFAMVKRVRTKKSDPCD